MQHEVVDVSSRLHSLYSLMDPVGLETLIVEVYCTPLRPPQHLWGILISLLLYSLMDPVGLETLIVEVYCTPLRPPQHSWGILICLSLDVHIKRHCM